MFLYAMSARIIHCFNIIASDLNDFKPTLPRVARARELQKSALVDTDNAIDPTGDPRRKVKS